MAETPQHYTLKVVRTFDGQVRVELRPFVGAPRYFASFDALAAFLKREQARGRQD